MAKVIITGGTGLVGRRLTQLLLNKGYEVNILCRNPQKLNEFRWDLSRNYIDKNVFEQADTIIHLAGAGVADQRWTAERKKEIINSRIQSTRLLHDYLVNNKHTVSNFISASAVGYYGDRGNELLTETSSAGSGFLADVCRQWEREVDTLAALDISVSKIRIGIVLSKDGGALPKLDFPIRFGIGAYIGNGKQYVPWIHIDDLCTIFLHLLENKNIAGTFNACAPDIRTNRQMGETIAKVLHRPFIPAPAPAFLLKAAMGEMAEMLLMSNNCSPEKITATGFRFQFPMLADALEHIYHTAKSN